MSQIIEVRFIHPKSQEVLADEFTKANSHQEAIELTLNTWSGGAGVLSRMEEYTPGEFVPAGSNSNWRYSYLCILEDPDNLEQGREMLAVLFTQYREKEEGKGVT